MIIEPGFMASQPTDYTAKSNKIAKMTTLITPHIITRTLTYNEDFSLEDARRCHA